jgi:hypothetical protein
MCATYYLGLRTGRTHAAPIARGRELCGIVEEPASEWELVYFSGGVWNQARAMWEFA